MRVAPLLAVAGLLLLSGCAKPAATGPASPGSTQELAPAGPVGGVGGAPAFVPPTVEVGSDTAIQFNFTDHTHVQRVRLHAAAAFTFKAASTGSSGGGGRGGGNQGSYGFALAVPDGLPFAPATCAELKDAPVFDSRTSILPTASNQAGTYDLWFWSSSGFILAFNDGAANAVKAHATPMAINWTAKATVLTNPAAFPPSPSVPSMTGDFKLDGNANGAALALGRYTPPTGVEAGLTAGLSIEQGGKSCATATGSTSPTPAVPPTFGGNNALVLRLTSTVAKGALDLKGNFATTGIPQGQGSATLVVLSPL